MLIRTLLLNSLVSLVLVSGLYSIMQRDMLCEVINIIISSSSSGTNKVAKNNILITYNHNIPSDGNNIDIDIV